MSDVNELAEALAHSLRTAQAGDASANGVEALRRRISNIAEQEACIVRAALMSADGEVSTSGKLHPTWSNFLLPASLSALGVFPIATEIEGHADLCDKATGRSAFSWVPPGFSGDDRLRIACLMRALRTDGDGNCLLHAAGLATWGIHDRTKDGPLGPLRDQVGAMLRSEELVALLLPRLAAEDEREDADIKVVMPEAARIEPRTEEELRREIEHAASRADRPGAYLDKLHIYALAHVLRRPLVVYAARSELGVDSIDGLYLPDLWSCAAASAAASAAPAVACSRTPLALAYTGSGSGGHFTACVSFDGFEHALPLTHHVDCARLPLRFAAPYGAPGCWEEVVGAHTDLGWWEHGGARYPLAYVSRGPCEASVLMLPAVAAMRERFVAKAAAAAAEEAAAAAAPPPPLPPPPPGWHALEAVLRRTEGAGFGLDISDDNEIGGVAPGSSCEGLLQPADRVVALDGRLLEGSLVEAITSRPERTEYAVFVHRAGISAQRRTTARTDLLVVSVAPAAAPPKGMPPGRAAPKAPPPTASPPAAPSRAAPSRAAPPPHRAHVRGTVPAVVETVECRLVRHHAVGLGLQHFRPSISTPRTHHDQPEPSA